jgi:uncharacterized protein DUF4824
MTPRWLLLGAAAVVCATNLGALALGALNRRDASEPAIVLTERELRFRDFGAESTATLVRLDWTPRDDAGFPCDRLRPLGFSCPDPPVSVGSDVRSLRQPQRNGYAVLEYDGPAWQDVMKRREAQAADSPARNASPTQRLSRLSADNHSRLVAIDIGPDAASLRRAYPDATRYIITASRIAIRSTSGPAPSQVTTLSGYIVELLPSTINVPRPFSPIVRGAVATRSPTGSPESWAPRYTVTLRYGRSLEPWIVDLRPLP